MPPPPARPRAEPVFQGSSPLPAHPPPPYSANPPSRASTPPRVHTPLTRRTEPMVIDTENDGDVSDSSMDTPATAKRYADAPDTTTMTNGPTVALAIFLATLLSSTFAITNFVSDTFY
ncbi:hypothetical protein KCU73_g17681, partial [Aureobasidium melanogenum]